MLDVWHPLPRLEDGTHFRTIFRIISVPRVPYHSALGSLASTSPTSPSSCIGSRSTARCCGPVHSDVPASRPSSLDLVERVEEKFIPSVTGCESWLVYTCNCIHRHSLLNATWYDRIWHDMTWHDIMWYDVMWCDMIWIHGGILIAVSCLGGWT